MTLATLLVPHTRGIGFFPVLRFAIVAPVTVLLGVGAAVLFRTVHTRERRPRTRLAVALGGLGVCLLGAAFAGPPGLLKVATPAVILLLGGLWLLVPRFMERPRPSRAVTAALVLGGALEVTVFLAALPAEGAPPRGPDGLTIDVPRSAFDVDHRFVDLPGGARVHYVDEGSGPTLLFLHGNPAWSFQWRELIRGLRGSFRCVALDYPGFGLSNGPPGFGFTAREQSVVVEQFVARLQLSDITLVMQDWGGPIGLGFAGRHPELVRRVVLGATWVSPTTAEMGRGKFSLIAGGPVGEFAQVNFNALASFAVTSSIVHPVSEEVRSLYLLPFRPHDRRGIAAFYPAQIMAATDYFEEVGANLARLAAKPALIFWAVKDPGSTPADRQMFEATFPDHRTVELPEASHFFFEDTAEQTISEIRSFAQPP